MVKQTTTCQCEVCGQEVQIEELHLNGIIYEAHGECKKCGLYSIDYAYGGFVVFIGKTEFTWHYSQTEDFQIDVRQKMLTAARKAKENFDKKPVLDE
jgi:hypothetical protein